VAPKANDSYFVGARVRHPDYGDGTIVAREGQAAGLKLSVRFFKAGTKKFIAKYAPLQVI
jgi:DNA helicase-2/ATP-dependent DNA helicase PcrA